MLWLAALARPRSLAPPGALDLTVTAASKTYDVRSPSSLSTVVVNSRCGVITALSLGTPQNTMSAHLAILANAGLVSTARNGKANVYKAVPATIAELSGFLSGLAAGTHKRQA